MVSKRSSVRHVKRLFWDIEVSPNVVLAFRAGYNLTINHDAIVQERKVICVGYKWEGEKKAKVLRWSKNQDDSQMLSEFMEVAEEADEMVGHYGDRFDLPWFRTRCLILGLPPLPPYKTIDTKAWASKYFYFNSNKLDYISKVLGYGGKEKMEFEDWKRITLHNCPKALDKMCFYCGKDVDRLEEVFHEMKFCVKPKTHAGVLAGLDKWTCPHDGSTNVYKTKTRATSNGTVQHQMKCHDCSSYFTISESAYKQYLEAKKKDGSRRT